MNKKFRVFDKVYGGLNGIEGILNKNIIDFLLILDEEINYFRFILLLGLGFCRYKLSDIDFCS